MVLIARLTPTIVRISYRRGVVSRGCRSKDLIFLLQFFSTIVCCFLVRIGGGGVLRFFFPQCGEGGGGVLSVPRLNFRGNMAIRLIGIIFSSFKIS